MKPAAILQTIFLMVLPAVIQGITVADAVPGGASVLRSCALAVIAARPEAERPAFRWTSKTAAEAALMLKDGIADAIVIKETDIPKENGYIPRFYAALPVIFYLNPVNPLEDMRPEVFNSIFGQGKANWLGLCVWNEPISVFFTNSAALRVNGLISQISPEYATEYDNESELVLMTAATPGGIGAGGWLDSCPATVKTASVNGIMPSMANIRMGKYPYSGRIALICADDEILRLLLSSLEHREAGKLFYRRGALPIP